MPCPAVRRRLARPLARALGLAALVVPFAAAGAQRAAPPPPPLDTTPRTLLPARDIAALPPSTVLENLAVLPDGSAYLSVRSEGRVVHVARDGTRRDVATVRGTIAGLAIEPDGRLLIVGWMDGRHPAVFRATPSWSGVPVPAGVLTTLPPEAIFPNGVVHLAGSRYLVADSYRGAIWQVDATTRATALWLADTLLTRLSTADATPGINGLHLHRDTLYVSNTQRAQLLKIPVVRGRRAGTPIVFAEGVPIDDFAIDPDGTIYGATHVLDRVVRVAPDGRVTVVAEAAQGVAGCTAVAFGRAADDRTGLYVVANGGPARPPAEGAGPARLVRLETAPSAAAR